MKYLLPYLMFLQLPIMFECAIHQIKIDIKRAEVDHRIFDLPQLNKTETEFRMNVELPGRFNEYVERDSFVLDRSPEVYEGTILYQFRNFYVRLNGSRDQSDFYILLRKLLKEECINENLQTVYVEFAASIARTYSFFTTVHFAQLHEFSEKVRKSRSTFLKNLFETNPGWYLSKKDIKYINILRNSLYNGDYDEIKSYKHQNGLNEEVHLPIFNGCGYEKTFTLAPDFISKFL